MKEQVIIKDTLALAEAVTRLEGDNCNLVNWIQRFHIV
jgi:hypothetical protein